MKVLLVLFFFLTLCFSNSWSTDLNAFNGGQVESFVLIGKMRAKPGSEEKLEEVLKSLSLSTYTEIGCIFYALHRDMRDYSVFVLCEGWRSKEDLEAHFNTPHFLQQFPVISSLIIGDPELSYLMPLGEGEKGNLLR